MKIQKGSSNRCGIFLYYDGQGIVDDYVIYLLKSFRPFLKHLLVMINGEVNEESMQKLNSVADEVRPRINEGFDVGGYRDGIFHIGFEKLAEYDETLLFNYTFFGPLFPLQEMFDKMDDMDLDFWGITRHYKVEPDPYGVNRYGYMPEHIQSHFMGLRRDFIKSKDYIEFITKLKNPTSYIESICEYETIFAKHFEDLGYRWDTYMDTSEYIDYSYCPVMFYLKDMMIKQRCPIVKRRSFFTDYNDFMLNTCGEASVDAIEYIRDFTDYDLDMAWDNLLRLENMTEMAKVLHLNYMLPANEAYDISNNTKQAVIIYLESIKHFDRYFKYIENAKEICDIYFVGVKEKIDAIPDNIKQYSKLKLIDLDEYMTVVRELKNIKADYDYIGFLVMADVEVSEPYSNYDSWQYRDWENLLGTVCIIKNVVATFEENNRLGMLVPPVPNHGSIFEKQADGWQNKFEEVDLYLKKLELKVNRKKQEPPLAPFGGSFWIRSAAITAEDAYVQTDNAIYKMALVYLVQSKGYLSGVCFNNEYAAIETTNLDYMMRELNKVVFEKYGPNYHNVVVNRIENNIRLVSDKAAGRREKIKKIIVTIMQKILPRKLYVKFRMKYLKMRGWI